MDYFEADIDTIELPPLKPNVVTLVFLYVLDDYGYVLDADLKVFGDEAFNSTCEIDEDQTINDERKRSNYGDSGNIVTPRRLFPRSRPADREFNKSIWGYPSLPADVHPPEKIKSRLPVSITPRLKVADKLDIDEKIPVASPKDLITMTSMIPIPATSRSKAVNLV